MDNLVAYYNSDSNEEEFHYKDGRTGYADEYGDDDYDWMNPSGGSYRDEFYD